MAKFSEEQINKSYEFDGETGLCFHDFEWDDLPLNWNDGIDIDRNGCTRHDSLGNEPHNIQFALIARKGKNTVYIKKGGNKQKCESFFIFDIKFLDELRQFLKYADNKIYQYLKKR